jgi:hypothetical protein
MKVDARPLVPADEVDALWATFSALPVQDRAAFLAQMIARSVKRVPA